MPFIDGKLTYGTGIKLANDPITNLPHDTIKVRRRLRQNCIATAFVKTARGVFQYYLERDGEALKLADYLINANVRKVYRLSNPCANIYR